MLSAETLATIKSTAPLLAEQGEAITGLFYSKLFRNHPELQHIFNMANQAQGEQPRALAESVFMYASHIGVHLRPLLGQPHAIAALAIGDRQRAHARADQRSLARQERVWGGAEDVVVGGVAGVPEIGTHYLALAASSFSSCAAGTMPGTRWPLAKNSVGVP